MTMNRAHEIAREIGLSQEESKQLVARVIQYAIWIELVEAEDQEKVREAVVQYVKEDIIQR